MMYAMLFICTKIQKMSQGGEPHSIWALRAFIKNNGSLSPGLTIVTNWKWATPPLQMRPATQTGQYESRVECGITIVGKHALIAFICPSFEWCRTCNHNSLPLFFLKVRYIKMSWFKQTQGSTFNLVGSGHPTKSVERSFYLQYPHLHCLQPIKQRPVL